MKRFAIVAAVLAAVMSAGAAMPAAAQQKKLAMGCTATASSHYAYCIGQAKAINSTAKDVNVSVIATGATTEKMVEVVMEHLGVTPKWMRGGTSDSVDAMKDKRIVGYAKVGNGFQLDASTMDIATQTTVRVLAFSDEQMKKVKDTYPYFPWVKVPANAIKGMGEFWTLAVVVGFGAPKTLSRTTSASCYYFVCLKLLRTTLPLIINYRSARPASKVLMRLQKVGFRKIEPL